MDKWVEYFSGTYYRLDAKHIYDFQMVGIRDEVWIPQVASEERVIITADAGKGGFKNGEKLPTLCVRFGITHVVLTPAIHHRRVIDKTSVLITVIADLLKLRLEPKGSRFSLRMNNSGTPMLVKISSPSNTSAPNISNGEAIG